MWVLDRPVYLLFLLVLPVLFYLRHVHRWRGGRLRNGRGRRRRSKAQTPARFLRSVVIRTRRCDGCFRRPRRGFR